MTAEALIKTLTASGDLTQDEWAQALRAVPRHLFVPDAPWAAPHGHDGYQIHVPTARWGRQEQESRAAHHGGATLKMSLKVA